MPGCERTASPPSRDGRRPSLLAEVAWHRRPRLVRRLAVFALANAFLVTLVLHAFPSARVDWPMPRHTLSYASYFLTFGTGEDSWWPMAEAAEHLHSEDAEGSVYEAIFFDRQIKFQYPLTSLLPMEAFGIPEDPAAVTYLTVISWLAVWANAVFVVLILFRALERYTPHLVPRLLADRAVLCLVAGAMTMTFFPISVSAKIGQVQVWINCLAAAMVWLWMTRREVLAGVAAGLICLIKPQLGLLLIWSVLRRRWGFSAAFACTAGVFGLVSVALYGLGENLAYLDTLSYMSKRGEAFFNNQSVNGLLNRLAGNGSNLVFEPDSFAPWNPAIYAVTLLSSLLIIAGALFWRRREHDRSSTLDLTIACLAFTMASPIAWDFHYGVLVPMYAVVLPALVRRPVWGRWSLPMLAVSFVVSSNYIDALQHLAGVNLLTPLQSGLFFSACFLLATAVKLRRAEASDQPATIPPAPEAGVRTLVAR